MVVVIWLFKLMSSENKSKKPQEDQKETVAQKKVK